MGIWGTGLRALYTSRAGQDPIPVAFRGPPLPTTGAPRMTPLGEPHGQGIGRGGDAPSKPSSAVATDTSVNGE